MTDPSQRATLCIGFISALGDVTWKEPRRNTMGVVTVRSMSALHRSEIEKSRTRQNDNEG